MKNTLNLITGLIISLCIISCKKDAMKQPPSSCIMYVVNGAINLAGVKVNPKATKEINYSNAPQVAFGARGIYYVQSNDPIAVVPTADTSTKIIYGSLGISKGTVSVFICGQSPSFDTLIREEVLLPYIPSYKQFTLADSIVNVRFVNLSPNSPPVKIKIAASTSNEVDQLPYKSISNWISYKAAAATTTYVFQVRDATTDVLLFTYTFSANATNRFKNVTLMVKGLLGTTTGLNAFGVAAINYF